MSGSRYSRLVLEDQPIFYVRLGEPVGSTTVRDWGPAQRGPFGVSGTPVFGQSGALANDPDGSVYFTGGNNLVNCTDIDVTGTAITLEAWFKVIQSSTPADAGIGEIIAKHTGTNDANGTVRVHRWDGVNGGEIQFLLTHGGSFTGLNSNSLIIRREANIWHHLAAVYDGAKMYIYLDGQLDASTTATGSLATNNEPWAIGALYNTGSITEQFKGWIDEAAVYPKALSAGRIAEHYQVGRTGHRRPVIFLVDPGAASTNISDSDSAVLTQSVVTAGPVSTPTDSDAGTLADSSTLTANTSSTDTLAAAEAAPNVALTSADTAAETDSGTVSDAVPPPAPGAETFTVTSTGTLAAAVSSSDAATLAEAGSAVIPSARAIADSDTVALTDAGSNASGGLGNSILGVSLALDDHTLASNPTWTRFDDPNGTA